MHFEGEIPPEMLDLHEVEVQPIGPVHYSLDAGLSDGGLFATGQVGARIRLQCVSCLERFEFPAEVPGFACQVELTGAEEVDLTEPIREDILLALPAHPHCDWNGARICPGLSLPESLLAAELPAEDRREVWDALDQLRLSQPGK